MFVRAVDLCLPWMQNHGKTPRVSCCFSRTWVMILSAVQHMNSRIHGGLRGLKDELFSWFSKKSLAEVDQNCVISKGLLKKHHWSKHQADSSRPYGYLGWPMMESRWHNSNQTRLLVLESSAFLRDLGHFIESNWHFCACKLEIDIQKGLDLYGCLLLGQQNATTVSSLCYPPSWTHIVLICSPRYPSQKDEKTVIFFPRQFLKGLPSCKLT